MTERSRFWDGTSVGDAYEAGYDAKTEFSKVLNSISAAAAVSNRGGVLRDELNELAVSGTSSPITIATGRAVVYGTWYENDSALTKTVSTPSSTRNDVVVLRKDWTAQTVRVVVKEGTTSLTQTEGTVWEIPLAYLQVTPSGVITVTDARQAVPSISHGHLGSWDDVSQLTTSGLSNNILSANASGRAKMQDGFFSADSTGRAKFANGFVNTDLIADSAVTHSKIVNRWRYMYVPAVWARNETDGIALQWGGVDTPGWQMTDNKKCAVAGGFFTPESYISDLTIYAVVHPQAGGNIYCENVARTAKNSETWPQHAGGGGYLAVTVSNDTVSEIVMMGVSSIDKQEYVMLRFTRDAVNALDTINNVVGFLGWIVIYLADM